MSVGLSMVHCFDPPLTSNNHKMHRAKPAPVFRFGLPSRTNSIESFHQILFISKSTRQAHLKRYIWQANSPHIKILRTSKMKSHSIKQLFSTASEIKPSAHLPNIIKAAANLNRDKSLGEAADCSRCSVWQPDCDTASRPSVILCGIGWGMGWCRSSVTLNRQP